MKKFAFYISMLFSLLYFTGCSGGSSSGGETGNDLPIITILGDNPALVEVNSTYNDAGATAWDPEDGDLTDQIKTNNTVDTSVVGDYTVTYTVTDFAQNTSTAVRLVYVRVPGEQPIDPDLSINGDALACDPMDTDKNETNDFSDDANETIAYDPPFKRNVSTQSVDDIASRSLQTSHNSFARFSMTMPETSANGDPVVDGGEYHPIAVLYLEQVGGDYEMGDGSADIGDPDNVDKVMVSLTRDNGQTWYDYNISNTTAQSSIEVVWNGQTIQYPGHAQKPEMAISGNNIVVAWNDKFCPSGNPFDLPAVEVDGNITYPDDLFGLNGTQGYIDYEGIVAPNGKRVYQVPFSCIWTARGIIDTDGEITWHAPMQLTAGVRDTNKIWLAGSKAGFAIAYQADPIGLKSGQGAGPGEGWSGATGNRGTDIWYSSLKAVDFNASSDHDDNVSTKEKSDNNFHYPVRITDNGQCQDKETNQIPYCEYYCSNYPTVEKPTGNEQDRNITQCSTPDTDMLSGTLSLLDGDTGASRVALRIFETNAEGEHVVVLGYEETKALTVRVSGEGDQDQGDVPTDIAVEGKSIYFESFDFNAIDELNISDASTILDTPMPLVSAGNVINVQVPRSDDTQVGEPGELIYENARRLVIGTQIDGCDANIDGNRTFAILYKQSFEVQGASSDMYVRAWEGFKYSDVAQINGLDVTNVSAQLLLVGEGSDPADYNETLGWSPDNLTDNTWENDHENTFSPRIFLRGANIFTGFEYTPFEPSDGEEIPIEGAIFPANFHTHLYIDGSWTGPKNITQVIDRKVNTVDARFFTTPKGSYDTTLLESDKSNPNVLFVTWGTTIDGEEANLHFKRSTDLGETWDVEQNLSAINRAVIQEKEVESFASPDGKTIYNVWLQQSAQEPGESNSTTGLDSWFGRVDYNISTVVEQ